MGVLIDLTVLIAHGRGHLDLSEKLARHEDEEFFISLITASEILHGVHRGTGLQGSDKKISSGRGSPGALPHPPGRSGHRPNSLPRWADLVSAGLVIVPHDLWIVATAIAHGLTLVTANLREFRHPSRVSPEVNPRCSDTLEERQRGGARVRLLNREPCPTARWTPASSRFVS